MVNELDEGHGTPVSVLCIQVQKKDFVAIHSPFVLQIMRGIKYWALSFWISLLDFLQRRAADVSSCVRLPQGVSIEDLGVY